MRKPTIHLNGTSAKSLTENYVKAVEALYVALGKLVETGPHGRDYYPQGEDAINEAEAEHLARVKALRTIIDELNELADHTDARSGP